ncbi:MAG: DUF5685 family protein [Lachnospiraceae bacterium]
MYGYVVVNKPELKIKEFQEYRSYYCGLCKSLQKKCGVRGQLSLSYDMTFLALLLSRLYEPQETEALERCIAHPVGKQRVKKNEILDYVADMSLLLSWYKCRDDYQDEKKLGKAVYGKTISKTVKQIEKEYERQTETVKLNMEQLSHLEQKKINDIDMLSGKFGNMLAEIFVIKQDEWETYLRKTGFYLGKFVYIIDAYDDLEKDREKGCFNPFLEKEKQENFDEWIKQLLVMIAAEFAKEFEKLPIIEDAEILRNIIYSGIWTRYEEVKKKRMKDMEEKHEKSI